MQVDGNIKALQNIGKAQEVAANNTANVNTDDFKASRAVQTGDRITISQDARHLASLSSEGKELSTSDPAKDMVQMSMNSASFEANVKAIQTQDDMNKALLDLKR